MNYAFKNTPNNILKYKYVRLSTSNHSTDVLASSWSCEMRHAGMWDQRKYHVSACVCACMCGESTHPSSHLNKPERRSIPRWAPQRDASGFTALSFSLTCARSGETLAHLPDSLCANVCMTIAGLAASFLSRRDFCTPSSQPGKGSTPVILAGLSRLQRSVKPLHFCSGYVPLPSD